MVFHVSDIQVPAGPDFDGVQLRDVHDLVDPDIFRCRQVNIHMSNILRELIQRVLPDAVRGQAALQDIDRQDRSRRIVHRPGAEVQVAFRHIKVSLCIVEGMHIQGTAHHDVQRVVRCAEAGYI